MEKEKAIELARKEADKWVNIEGLKVINIFKTDKGWYIEFGGDNFFIIGGSVYFVSYDGEVHVVGSDISDPEMYEYEKLLNKQEEK